MVEIVSIFDIDMANTHVVIKHCLCMKCSLYTEIVGPEEYFIS